MKIAPLQFALRFNASVCVAGEHANVAFALQKGTQAPGNEALSDEALSDEALSDEALNDLAFYALSLAGTPYKYGGSSPDTGFDCSGFVGHVFRQSLGIELPRSSHEINVLGDRIDPNELRPGDLVFYNTLRRAFSHVGIYLGDDRFVHSPSSDGGIRVEDMNQRYWKKRYNGARRITAGG